MKVIPLLSSVSELAQRPQKRRVAALDDSYRAGFPRVHSRPSCWNSTNPMNGAPDTFRHIPQWQ
jgi:hypothetical protein